MTNRNSAVAIIGGIVVRALELCSLRGAPTLFTILAKVPTFGRMQAIVRLGNGVITFPAFDGYWCRYLWAGAAFEQDVAQTFAKLGKDAVLIDCGANIGYWSVRAAEFGFREVVAVEANASLIPMLRKNFELNAIPGEVLHAAIYSKAGEHLFLDRTAAHVQGSLGKKGMPVISTTITEIVASRAVNRQFVAKLDVEGAEVAAIDGASGVDRITFVYEDFPRHGMRVTEELLRRGYAVFGVAPSGECRRIGSVEEAIRFNADFTIPRIPSNLVACRPDRADWLERKLRA